MMMTPPAAAARSDDDADAVSAANTRNSSFIGLLAADPSLSAATRLSFPHSEEALLGTKKKKSRILLYGGSFDPPHKGHIEIARFIWENRDKLGLDEVWLLPCGAQEGKPLLSPFSLRVRMTQLALEDNLGDGTEAPGATSRYASGASEKESYAAEKDTFVVSTAEGEVGDNLAGDTYKVLDHLTTTHPDKEWSFLVGEDLIQSFLKYWDLPDHPDQGPDWDTTTGMNWARKWVARLSSLVVVSRAGSQEELQRAASDLLEKYRALPSAAKRNGALRIWQVDAQNAQARMYSLSPGGGDSSLTSEKLYALRQALRFSELSSSAVRKEIGLFGTSLMSSGDSTVKDAMPAKVWEFLTTAEEQGGAPTMLTAYQVRALNGKPASGIHRNEYGLFSSASLDGVSHGLARCEKLHEKHMKTRPG